ncbi:MAG: GntR family transcriptional regulator [Bacillota bacterium]|nr:GntR family transcriptional regulator [Bacillota bacterium]
MEFKNGKPIYSQIVDELTMRIVNGTYKQGDKLPSVRELAVEMGVNPNTMQRALAELERNGLVYTERTNGRFVTEEENMLKELRSGLVEEYIAEFVEKLHQIGMEDREIEAAIAKWLKEV